MIRMDHFSDPLRTEPLEPTTRPEYRYKGVPNDVVCNPNRRIMKNTIPTMNACIKFKANQAWSNEVTNFKLRKPYGGIDAHSHAETWGSVLKRPSKINRRLKSKLNKYSSRLRQQYRNVQIHEEINRRAGSQLSRLLYSDAGTLGSSDPVSHDCGSFVERGPTIMPHPPAKNRSFTSFQMVHTHMQTNLYIYLSILS